MSVFFAGKQCLDPAQEATNCRELGYALGPWVADANGFTCPLGQAAGRGRILMRRADLDAIDREALHDLVFREGNNVVTLKSLLIVRAVAITPGYRADPQAAYWVEIADKRYLCRGVPIDQAFNVRATPSGSYFSATLNSGVAWTWAGMTQTIWTAVGKLGTWPGLPFTPDGTPDGFSFYGGRAHDALGQVLDRIGCALRLDPTTGTFTIVRIGSTDAAAELALATVERSRVWDDEPLDPVRSRIPASVRVLFRKQRLNPDTTGASPYYTVDATDPSGTQSGVESGTYVVLTDDLPATYDSSNTLTNSSALSSRATDRATDYFRRVRLSRLRRTFSGLRSSAGLLPGPQVKAIRWSERAGLGVLTEVFRDPGLPAPVVPYSLGGPSPVPEGSDGDGIGIGLGGGIDVVFPQTAESTFVEDGYDSPASGDTYEFAFSTLVAEEVDGTPSYGYTSTLQFDQTDGFSLSQPAAGRVRVDLLPAADTQIGVVNLVAQKMGRGLKSFDGVSVLYDGLHDLNMETNLTLGVSSDAYLLWETWYNVTLAARFGVYVSSSGTAAAFQFWGNRYSIVTGAVEYLGQSGTYGGMEFVGGILVGGTYDGVDEIVGDDGTTTGLTLDVTGSPPSLTITLGGTLDVLHGGVGLSDVPPAGSMLTGDGSGYTQSRAPVFLYRWGTD